MSKSFILDLRIYSEELINKALDVFHATASFEIIKTNVNKMEVVVNQPLVDPQKIINEFCNYLIHLHNDKTG